MASFTDESGPSIDLVSIRQALLVAEHLSFRQAASVLGVQQSAVSRRIRSLEDILGVSLFERHPGGVRLTAAGVRFLDRARQALSQLDNAVKSAGVAGRGESGHVSLGICSSIGSGFLRELISMFGAQHPQVALQMSEATSREHLALVRKARLDIAFVMGKPDAANFETAQLWTERIFIVLPKDHVLCSSHKIEWQSLRNEHFIFRHSDPGPAIENYLIKRVGSLGHRLSIRRFDVGRETSLHLVSLGLGVSLTTEVTTACSYPGVEFRPIAGTENVIPFNGVWSPNNDNPAFRRFLSLARVLSKQWNADSNDVKTSSPAAPRA